MTVEPVGSTYQYAYDAEDRLTGVSGGANASYTYDGNDLRVKKAISGGTTTIYVFALGKDIAEYDNGATVTSPSREYVYSGDTLISTLSGGTTTYHHADHLSTRVTTDGNGNVVGQQGHFPFGEPWYSSNATTKFLFTSYEHDSETGLDYALARFYDSRMGRFCSPDPADGSPDDPQSWNRYAYSRNNPVNLIDPSGKSWLTDLFTAIAMIAIDIFFPPAAPAADAFLAEGAADASWQSIVYGLGSAAISMDRMSQMMSENFPAQNAVKSQNPPPAYTPCPKVFWIFTPIHKNQAPGNEPTGMNSHMPGSASVDPRQFGYDYPGPDDQSKAAWDKRDQSMRKFNKEAGPKSPILIYPQGPLPKNWPKPPYTVRGIGDKNVRQSHDPWADVRVKGNKTQFKTTLPAVVLVPPGVPCPHGPR